MRLLLAAVLSVSLLGVPAAHAEWHRGGDLHRDWHRGGPCVGCWVGGAIVGGLLGSMIAPPPAPPPVYVAPTPCPNVWVPPQYGPYGWTAGYWRPGAVAPNGACY